MGTPASATRASCLRSITRAVGDALVGGPKRRARQAPVLGSDDASWFFALSKIVPPRTAAIVCRRGIARCDQPSILLEVKSEPQRRLGLGKLVAESALR
jgi:hypothetical protein